MKIQFQDAEIPYPLSIMKGRLRLSGLDDTKIAAIVSKLLDESESENMSEKDLLSFVQGKLQTESSERISSFNTIITYENLRSEHEDMPPIIVVIEGASATGKSMIALDLIQVIASTRFISTDTIRQLLRNIYSKEEYPELHCHTYQAFKYRQVGVDQNPMIRGYKAQCELVTSQVKEMVYRIISEGAIAVIEGVHIQPGSMKNISEGVLEILINPSYQIHQMMFSSKSGIGKLRSVSSDEQVRKDEFISTRIIQEYLEKHAIQNEITIINMQDYEQANQEIYRLIVMKMNQLIRSYQ
ncbi:hypothetical protein EU527_07475 [Candidatus Thorarchaeota archaeon]|nr:MAG: hypothetical protein EU527_07475 [Candidatus Thorarchaeota archaeon]